VRQFFLIFLFCFAFAFSTPAVLGPNIEYGAFGAAAPADIRGAFVPQFNTNLDFFWLEPLGADGYGTWKPNKTNYIKFLAGMELSPFYGTVRAGIGITPLPPPFAVLEFRFVYSNENMFWSNVEMPMKLGEQPFIGDVWDAGYMFDKFYKRSSYAQIQSYSMQLAGTYTSQSLYLSFLFYFSFIDITSDYDEKKSFDYMLGLPLYSRDYVVAEEFSLIYNFGKNFSWNTGFTAMLSGRQFKFYAPFNTYDKEPLVYYMVSTGPLWRFEDGKSYISLCPGYFTRNSRDSVIKDSMKEKILLSVQYRYFWDFKFGKQ
jgi:hypothetical protein